MSAKIKVWYGLKSECQTPENALAFYVDEADKPQVRLYKSLKEIIKMRDEYAKEGNVHEIFKITYEVLDV